MCVYRKVFVSLSWMAKASVQAALGPVFLKRLAEDPNANDEERRLAEIMLTICVLSIILTAPIGALLIAVFGTKLLTKTKPLQVSEGLFLQLTGFFKIQFLINSFRLATESSSFYVCYKHQRRRSRRTKYESGTAN